MKKLYLIAGVLAFLASLIALAPASYVYGWLQGALPPQVRLYDVDGSVFRGHAAQARIEGIVVHDLTWHMHPAALLLGHVSLDLDGVAAGGRTSALATLSPSGRMTLRDVVATATLSGLSPVLGVTSLPADGQVGLRLKRAVIDNGHVISAKGQLNLGELSWTLSTPSVALGDYKAEISTDKQGVSAVLDNANAPIELSGRCLLTRSNRWQAHVRLRSKPKAGADVKNLLNNLGRPGPQGWYNVRQQGQL